MYSYWFIGSAVPDAAGSLKGKSQAWSHREAKALKLPALKLGSFDTLVRLTEDLAKADSLLESSCRRIERTVAEADKELEIRDGEKQVYVTATAKPKDGAGGDPEVEGWYHKVGTHNAKPLYKSARGPWLYWDQSTWYIDIEKSAGVGANQKTFIFSQPGGDAPPNLMQPNSALYSGHCNIKVDAEIPKEPPVALPPRSDERAFKIQQAGSSWIDVDEYIQKFEWDNVRFPQQKSVSETLSTISKLGNDFDDTFKQLSQAYNEEKGKKSTVNTKDSGSHATRDLVDILTPQTVTGGDGEPKESDDFIFTNSITTVVVVVHDKAVKEFKDFYDAEPDERVIPRSAQKLEKVGLDKDGYGLWRVLCFKDSVDKFKKACRDAKYTVRDYQFTIDNYKQAVADREVANANFIIAHRKLVEGGICAFSDLLVSWAHVKALRLVVEGALRYGTKAKTNNAENATPNMTACVVAPNANALAKARADLSQVLGNQGDRNMEGGDDAEEFYPYVFVSMVPLSTSK